MKPWAEYEKVKEENIYLKSFRKYLIVVWDFLETFDSTYGFMIIPQNKML